MKGYPKIFSRLMLLAFLILLGSGFALLPNLLVFKWDIELDSTFEGATRMKIAAAHLGAALACVWFVGAMWPVHIRSGMRRRKNRVSGFLMIAVLLALSASGIAFYYLGDETWQKYNSGVHVAAAALLVLASGAHWIMGRRLARESRAHHGRH
jgi:cation transport ATPase